MVTRYWDQKPPLGATIDFSHPLSRGLVGAWLMNEGGGKIVNDIARKNNGIINGADWVPSKYGKALFFGNNDKITFNSNNPIGSLLNGARAISIVSRLNLNTFDSAEDNWIFGTRINLLSAGFEVYFPIDNIRVAGRSVSTDTYQSYNVSFAKLNQWVSIVCIMDIKGKIFHTYIDNIKNISTGKTFGNSNYTVGSPAQPDTIGNSPNIAVADGAFHGSIEYVYTYNRALSPQEIQQLYIGPYQFMVPIKRKSYFVSTTPPAPAITGDHFMTCGKYW